MRSRRARRLIPRLASIALVALSAAALAGGSAACAVQGEWLISDGKKRIPPALLRGSPDRVVLFEHRGPVSALRGRARPQIHHHVEHPPAHAVDELGLFEGRGLVVQPPHGARARVCVLCECVCVCSRACVCARVRVSTSVCDHWVCLCVRMRS